MGMPCCSWMPASGCALHCGLQHPLTTPHPHRRATTNAPLPTSPSESGTAGAAFRCPWCTPPSSSTCGRRRPGAWPSTRHTPTTPGLLMTSSSSLSPASRQVSEAGHPGAGWVQTAQVQEQKCRVQMPRSQLCSGRSSCSPGTQGLCRMAAWTSLVPQLRKTR